MIQFTAAVSVCVCSHFEFGLCPIVTFRTHTHTHTLYSAAWEWDEYIQMSSEIVAIHYSGKTREFMCCIHTETEREHIFSTYASSLDAVNESIVGWTRFSAQYTTVLSTRAVGTLEKLYWRSFCSKFLIVKSSDFSPHWTNYSTQTKIQKQKGEENSSPQAIAKTKRSFFVHPYCVCYASALCVLHISIIFFVSSFSLYQNSLGCFRFAKEMALDTNSTHRCKEEIQAQSPTIIFAFCTSYLQTC